MSSLAVERKASVKKTRVMFMAWGYSIHAKRRIQLFVDDPDFEVAVVSTHNYNFDNAVNYLLANAVESKNTEKIVAEKEKTSSVLKQSRSRKSLLRKIISQIASFPLSGLLLSLLWECRTAQKDYKILKSAVKEFKPDVVFLQTLLYPCYLSYFLPRSIPIMITFWNGDVTWWAKWNGIDRLLKKQIVTYGARRAAAVTVNTQMAFNTCIGYGTRAENIHLVRYPGVNMERFKPTAKEDARKKIGITAEKVVLCPRGIGGYLNSDIIIESAALVVKKYPETLFVFVSGVGGEAEWKRHLQRARELGIEGNIRREGQVPWDEMPWYYNSVDVMVSILSNDSLPNCMLESMACGVPVIMGDIPQIREWVVDGVNGFLVEPRDFSALSDRIIKSFDNRDQIIDSFIKNNLEIIKNKADSNKNIIEIKEVVRRVASANNKSVLINKD